MKSNIREYVCAYCKNKYKMDYRTYGQRSLTAAKRCCTSPDCLYKASMKWIESKKEKERKKKKKIWKEKKLTWKNQLTNRVNPLQVAVNHIARLIDKDNGCLARPFEKSNGYDGGHIYATNTHPNIRYNLWNIHKQGIMSNRILGGEQSLMLSGIKRRYGDEVLEMVKGLNLKYPTLKPTKHELEIALTEANKIIRELKKGKIITRDEANERIGLYI